MQAKSDLLECLSLLPSTSLYSPKFVHILHSVCEEIVNEKTSFIPSIFKKLVPQDDLADPKTQKPQYYAQS